MKVVLLTGRVPYNLCQEQSLCEMGIEAQIFMDWGIHLPDHVEEILQLKPDIIHLQWPESLCRYKDLSDESVLKAFTECLPKLKSRGAKLFWTMHNLLPHDRSREALWRKVYQAFAAECDVCCHHSVWGREVVLRSYTFPHQRHELLRHGYVDPAATASIERSAARDRLGIPPTAHVFVSFGGLRPDKRSLELVRVFRDRDPDKDFLLFGGLSNLVYAREVIEEAKSVPNVIIREGWLSDEMVSHYVHAGDTFLYLHGENHLTSGAPHLSQTHLLPQITFDYPYAREVLGTALTPILGNRNPETALHQILDDFDPEQMRGQREVIEQSRHPWNWREIASETRIAYERALST